MYMPLACICLLSVYVPTCLSLRVCVLLYVHSSMCLSSPCVCPLHVYVICMSSAYVYPPHVYVPQCVCPSVCVFFSVSVPPYICPLRVCVTFCICPLRVYVLPMYISFSVLYPLRGCPSVYISPSCLCLFVCI